MQAHLLDTVLARRWTYELTHASKLILAVIVSFVAAWFLLAIKGSKGSPLAVGVMVGYVALVTVALPAAGWVLPLTIPLASWALVILGATLLERRLSVRKIMLLEQDMLRIHEEMGAVREALVCRENAVDALEEDLESARLSVSSSVGRQQELMHTTDALRAQIDEAQVQEEAARRRIDELEQELGAIRAAGVVTIPLGDDEQEHLRQECEQVSIITAHPPLLSEFRDLKKAARTSLTILITGEPGTGKELFARAVHRLSARAGRSFIAVNMAAISPELFESELFGHLRGSFTGAVSDRKGYFELAHQGTIFLDEIGDLRLDHQSKLLRVLQEQTFYRVGATGPITVDVRIVAATNKDLQRGVSEGWFREDLYFRLKGFVLRLPPLRERRKDIGHIAKHVIRQMARRRNGNEISLSDDAWLAVTQHEWKGNVRELQHCLERADALSEGRTMTRDDLRLSPGIAAADLSREDRLMPDPAGDAAVLDILRQQGFDMQATAKTLGWDRTTVTQRLKGLCFQTLVACQGNRTKAATALAGNPALVRTVELKIMDYHGHLQNTIQQFATVEEALPDCKRRFKNLPERHFKSVEALVREYFNQKSDSSLSLTKHSQPTR
jgi:DNA-binding NtrC family response regulator